MYPRHSGAPDNHKKGYCVDDVRTKPKAEYCAESTDPTLPRPNEPHFHPLVFLATFRELYGKVIDRAIS